MLENSLFARDDTRFEFTYKRNSFDAMWRITQREVSSKGKRGDDGLPLGSTRKLFRMPSIRVIYRNSHFRRLLATAQNAKATRYLYTGRAIKAAINYTLDKSSHI